MWRLADGRVTMSAAPTIRPLETQGGRDLAVVLGESL